MTLEELRELIDKLNCEIIHLFSKRLDVAKEIARVKKEHKLPVYDPKREEKQLLALQEEARKQNLSPAVIEEIFQLFVEYSKLNMKLEMGHEQKNRLPGS